MKKALILTLVLALAAALAIPAFGAGSALLGDGLTAPVASNSSDHYQITANGKAIDANACVLVPVRAVSEALGFEVSWNQDKTITVDNGIMHAELTIGKDSYIVVTSNSELVGMSAPFSLGAAPILINNVAYVPAGLFRALLGNSADALVVNGNTIAFHSISDSTEIPNPLQEHATLDTLIQAVGFEISLPDMPAGYKPESMRDIGAELAEVTFSNGSSTIIFRVHEGTEDYSGIYEAFSKDESITLNGISVRCRGNGQQVQLANWSNHHLGFSIYAADGLSQEQIAQIVTSL